MNDMDMGLFYKNSYKLLHQLGVSANYKGFLHVVHAVTLCMQQQERLLPVTKWLYPDVARHYGTSWKAVERNIRTVSAIAWERNRPLLEALAQRHLERCPCPAEFLVLLFRAVQPKELMTGGQEQS